VHRLPSVLLTTKLTSMRSSIVATALGLYLLGGMLACRDVTGVPPAPAPLQYVPGEVLVEHGCR
jgi:hypothetical protein